MFISYLSLEKVRSKNHIPPHNHFNYAERSFTSYVSALRKIIFNYKFLPRENNIQEERKVFCVIKVCRSYFMLLYGFILSVLKVSLTLNSVTQSSVM